ncbi:DUF2271 domain-containing protein [Deinococcus roseus]|uniref:DUF2271 domain-containing protein n=1 Tax=Deinococcus roseus TaxID=392414 RepID=A0ABQ2CY12_9DEIO|nr:DUF2271 domain-containing protein [Deinococcus roseus]GGJ31774.1 hypothetical protein GCM10008938_17400 [Deinococcus roseus]
MTNESSTPSRYSRRRFLVQGTLFAAGLTFTRLLGSNAFAQSKKALLPENMALGLSLTLVQPAGGRVERPYIAVWIEDEAGNPVRTLALWVNKAEKERTRWINELRRWFRGDTARKGKGGENLVPTLSSATRQPGKYSVEWDGKDDRKEQAEQGDYYICIESAREHGKYHLIREKVSLGKEALSKTLKGNIEIQEVALDYRTQK